MSTTNRPAGRWIADRMRLIESSGIRKVFDLARSLKDPVNLSIGQPDFDVPAPIKAAAHAAIEQGLNAYTVTQGIPELRARLTADIRQHYHHSDREVFITSGTSGGLLLGLCCTVNPGDEVIVFDPYFVMYPHLITLAGGTTVYVDTYPDFRIDLAKVRQAVTQRTKAIIVNSPANPTGQVLGRDSLRGLARLAQERDILLFSDEVYRVFCYDEPFCSAAEFNENVLVLDGFSKAYGMTGWRLGFAHRAPVHHRGDDQVAAIQFRVRSEHRAARRCCRLGPRRSRFCSRVSSQARSYLCRFAKPLRSGPIIRSVLPVRQAPWGTGSDFVAEAIRNQLLIIPGNVFSQRDTHFRISYAADDRTIDRGIEILNRLAQQNKG